MKSLIKKLIVLALALALLIIFSFIFYFSLYSTKEIKSGVINYKDYDYFYYNGEAWKISYVPKNVMNEGSPESLRIDPLAVEGGATFIRITECLESCNYKDFKIKIIKVSDTDAYFTISI